MRFRYWFAAGSIGTVFGGLMLARANVQGLGGVIQGIAGLALIVAGVLLVRHGWNRIGDDPD